jgi:hypothetical protein
MSGSGALVSIPKHYVYHHTPWGADQMLDHGTHHVSPFTAVEMSSVALRLVLAYSAYKAKAML